MGNRTRIIGKLALSLICGGLLALAQPGMRHGHLTLGARRAFACGLGQTATMQANAQPALAYPLTPQSPSDAPVGVFGTDYYANQTVNLAEDLSRLPTPINPNDYRWQWDFGDGGKAEGFSVQHAFSAPGDYTVRLELDDPAHPENNTPNFDSAALHVIAQPFANPPLVHAAGSGTYVQMGSDLSYDASGSSSQVGGDLTYTWNFGDTQIGHGAQVAHTFTLPGVGFVALVVQDQRGAKAMMTIPIDVVTVLPHATLAASTTTGQTGSDIIFDASGSTPLPVAGDTLTKYQWSFGDGSNRTTKGPKTNYAFDHPGTYTVTVQAIDQNGYPGTATLVVHVTAQGFSIWPWVAGMLMALALLVSGWVWWRRSHAAQLRLAFAARKGHAKKRG